MPLFHYDKKFRCCFLPITDNKDEHHEEPENHNEGSTKNHDDAAPYNDETLQSLVDPILEMMDKDKDGYITYSEYRQTENAQAP